MCFFLYLFVGILFHGVCACVFFFFKQKTAYEMRISDWSSDVCSSDLRGFVLLQGSAPDQSPAVSGRAGRARQAEQHGTEGLRRIAPRSEEHTSELQSLMRNSYAVFCLKKKTTTMNTHTEENKATYT